MRCCSSSTRSSCSRSERDRGRAALATAAGWAALVLAAGCGEQDDGPAAPAGGTPEPTSTLRIATGERIETLDPLLADDRAERLASRQVHEPLISRLSGPFAQARQRPGLARSFRSRNGDTVWTVRLRGGVRFQNGEPLDAAAVQVNAERWLALAPGRALLPQLAYTDFPRQDIVRFLLSRPTPGFPRQLADPRLGLVAPKVLARAGHGEVERGPTGTGPFELRESSPDRTLLARNAAWWGGEQGLGPGVAEIELLAKPSSRLRLAALEGGSVEIADELGRGMLRRVERNPLLSVVTGGGALALERSVRGIESARADQPLSDVWLTDLP